jgi:hypothetical protein
LFIALCARCCAAETSRKAWLTASGGADWLIGNALDLRRRRRSRRAIAACSARPLLDVGAAGADRVVERDARDHRPHRAFGDLADGVSGSAIWKGKLGILMFQRTE